MLVEDHPVVLRGLRAVTDEHDEFVVAGEASTAVEALELAKTLRPDVVVLPVRLGGTHSGVELCRAIKTVCPARVIVFTSFTRHVDIQVALLAGADALVSKTATGEAFIGALQQVTAGVQALVLSQDIVSWSQARQFEGSEKLTEREDEILQLVTEGLTNPDIAIRLSIEISTVKTHVRSILRKLKRDSRRDLFRSR
ncbi:response regulator [Rhodococcus sp. IEGM1428]|uniref:response regulator n=1 Tax=Rhodococcus sp. IEGM1428 TaxID=3392191 RepID=UPI003D0EB076